MPYQPGPVPRETEELGRYISEELQRIADALINLEPDSITWKDWRVTPPRPREGMLVFTDSDAVSPPLGSGLLIYYGGAWKKLRDN